MRRKSNAVQHFNNSFACKHFRPVTLSVHLSFPLIAFLILWLLIKTVLGHVSHADDPKGKLLLMCALILIHKTYINKILNVTQFSKYNLERKRNQLRDFISNWLRKYGIFVDSWNWSRMPNEEREKNWKISTMASKSHELFVFVSFNSFRLLL